MNSYLVAIIGGIGTVMATVVIGFIANVNSEVSRLSAQMQERTVSADIEINKLREKVTDTLEIANRNGQQLQVLQRQIDIRSPLVVDFSTRINNIEEKITGIKDDLKGALDDSKEINELRLRLDLIDKNYPYNAR